MSAGAPLFRAFVALGALAVLAVLFFLIEPGDAYDWIKALHVIAVISWMAGMLYLPRLFVYHASAVAGSEKSETFKVMERRLLRAIINPAMIVTWAAGLWLAWYGSAFTDTCRRPCASSPLTGTKNRPATGGSSMKFPHC